MALLSWPYYRSNDAGHHGRASNTGRAGVHSSGNNSLSGTFNAAAIFRNIGNRGSLNPRSMLLICCRQRFVRIASSRCDNLFSRRISAIFCPIVFMCVRDGGRARPSDPTRQRPYRAFFFAGFAAPFLAFVPIRSPPPDSQCPFHKPRFEGAVCFS